MKVNAKKPDKESVLALLLMNYKISPTKSLPMVEDWLTRHPQASWSTLKQLFHSQEVDIIDGVLTDLNPCSLNIDTLAQEMRSVYGIEIKDRRYLLKIYPNCFVGSEAVAWLMRTQGINKSDAICIGQIMMKRGLIHHVVDEHDFKDEYLFYCFSQDE